LNIDCQIKGNTENLQDHWGEIVCRDTVDRDRPTPTAQMNEHQFAVPCPRITISLGFEGQPDRTHS
jgi:hypothetical protein